MYRNALHLLSHAGLTIVLNPEQRMAIENILRGNDVIAILPTGYGKSIIFSVYVLAKQELLCILSGNTDACSVLVISALQSIIND